MTNIILTRHSHVDCYPRSYPKFLRIHGSARHDKKRSLDKIPFIDNDLSVKNGMA